MTPTKFDSLSESKQAELSQYLKQLLDKYIELIHAKPKTKAAKERNAHQIQLTVLGISALQYSGVKHPDGELVQMFHLEQIIPNLIKSLE